MKKLVVLVGNIGSGKTTYTHKLVADGYVAVSRDALRYMIGNGKYIFNPNLEYIIFNSEHDILKNFMSSGVDIVVDEVGIDRHTRSQYIKLAKHFNYQVICIKLPKYSMKECVDRRMQDPHGQPDRALWESVWIKFNKRYQAPTLKEGFDKIIQLRNKKSSGQKYWEKNMPLSISKMMKTLHNIRGTK